MSYIVLKDIISVTFNNIIFIILGDHLEVVEVDSSESVDNVSAGVGIYVVGGKSCRRPPIRCPGLQETYQSSTYFKINLSSVVKTIAIYL